MPVVGREAWKRGAAGVLIEKLQPIETITEETRNEVVGNIVRPLHTQAARITRAPAVAPTLLPELLLVGSADGFRALLLLEKLRAIVAGPVVLRNPTRAVGIAAHVPAALAGLHCELA